MQASFYWIYMLSCSNGSYYTGYTTDLKRRFQEHCLGTAKSKYTRAFGPVALAQAWQVYENISKTLKIEAFIKKQSHHKKQELVLNPERLAKLYQTESLNIVPVAVATIL